MIAINEKLYINEGRTSMKHLKRIFAVIIVLATLVTAAALPTFAANTSDARIYHFKINAVTNSDIAPQEKQDTSPCYLWLQEGDHSVKVSARGCDNQGKGAQNLTYVKGSIVDHVTCKVGNQYKYSISTLIRERGYNYATLWMKSSSVLGDMVSGYWSPDSAGRYTPAT